MRTRAATVPDLDMLATRDSGCLSEESGPLIIHARSEPALTFRSDMLVELRVRRYRETPKAFGGFESGKRRARTITDQLLLSSPSQRNFGTDDLEKDAEAMESRATSALYTCIMISATSSFLWGYHTAVMSPAEASALPHHSMESWSAVVTAMVAGAIVGSLMGDSLAETRGRKQSVLITSALNLLGSLIMLVAGESVPVAICARLLVGIGAGLTMCVVPVYIGEIAPVQLRASLNGVPQLMNCMGILVAELLGLFNVDAFGLFGIAAAIACLQLIAGLGFPLEPSPEYLVSHSGGSSVEPHGQSQTVAACPRRDQTIAVCKRLYGYDDEEAIQHVEVMERACKCSMHPPGPNADAVPSGGLFSDAAFGIMTISVVMLNVTQQMSGFNAVLQYSGTFFKPLFDNPNMPAVMVGVANLCGSLSTMKLMQYTRRKVLLIVSLSGMLLATLMVTLCSGMLVVVAVVAFAVCFQLGLGPLPGCLSSEMYDSTRRSSAQSVAAAMNNLANCVVTFSFPLVYREMQGLTFAIFGTVLALALAFVIAVLPETLDKHPDQIHADLSAVFETVANQGPRAMLLECGLDCSEPSTKDGVDH